MCKAAKSPARARRRLFARLRGFHGDRGGQISLLTVFGVVILASLLGMVVTTGDQVTQKLEMQNAVDAAALSGGAWIARGLNVTSGFNLLQTQLMAGALLLRGLDAALEDTDRVLGLWIRVLQLCSIWNPGCAVLLPINEIQHALLQVLKPIVRLLTDLFAGCPPGQLGLFWLISEGLELVNSLVHHLFVVVAWVEAWDLGLLHGADETFLLPGPFLHEDPKWTMPTRRETVDRHCDPMEFGSRERLHRGYHPLAGYSLGEGPFRVGRERLRGLVWLVAGVPPFGIWFYDSRVAAEKNAACRGDHPCGSWLPEPFLLDPSNDGLQFLVLSRRENRRLFFNGSRVSAPPTFYTYAQVEIYNAVNGDRPDAYTQDWRVRLAPAALIAAPIENIGSSTIGLLIDDFVRTFLEPGLSGTENLDRVGNH